MKIEIIKCLTDNFSYLLINEKNLDTCVVDPGEAKPVLEYIKKNNLKDKFIAVGFTEYFDESLLLYKKKLNWPKPIYYAKKNVTKNKLICVF